MNRKTEMPKATKAIMTDKTSKKEQYSGGMKNTSGPGSKVSPSEKGVNKPVKPFKKK